LAASESPPERSSRRPALALLVAASVGATFAIAYFLRPSVDSDVAAMNEGVAILERYEYSKAREIFDRLATRYPEWTAAHVNRGLAALNVQEYDVARGAFERALELDPDNRHALFCLGVLDHHLNRLDAALERFRRVVELDPDDPHARYKLGSVFADKNDAENGMRELRKALLLQPSFGSAWYRLASFYRGKDTGENARLIGEFTRLKEANAAILVGEKYGEAGRYSLAIRGTTPPGAGAGSSRVWRPAPVAFGTPRSISRATRSIDTTLGAVAAGLALGDLDGDGALELVLCGVPTQDGGAAATQVAVHEVGADGAWQLSRTLAVDAALCALGDLDGDTDLDLLLSCSDRLRVFINDGAGAFGEAPFEVGEPAAQGTPVRLALVDVDSDWDLDIVSLRHVAANGAIRSVVRVLSNNRDGEIGALGSFRDIATQCGIASFDFAVAELVIADLDGDIDLDFLVIDGRSGRPHAFANDRAWKFHAVEMPTELAAPGVRSTVVCDLDADGHEDVVALCGDRAIAWRNLGQLRFAVDDAFASRAGSVGGTAGCAFDFRLELRTSLLVVDGRMSGSDGAKGAKRGAVWVGADAATVAIPSDATPRTAAAVVNCVDRTGRIQLIVSDDAGVRAYDLTTPGARFVADLAGPKAADVKAEAERSNPGAIGATVELRVGRRALVRQLMAGAAGGTACDATRLACGLADGRLADQLRVLWPDGILQSELALVGGKVHTIDETERKPTSCPVLFAWNGTELEFVADFLGVGGLGYFEAPGRYSQPDPTEMLHLPHLKPRAAEDGGGDVWDLRVLESLEECTYLDSARLVAVDHPASVTVLPLEMFAIAGPAPGYELLAFDRQILPCVARDQDGRDVTQRVRELDRSYAPDLERDARFAGVLRRAQAIELEFPDSIEGIIDDSRSGVRPVLFLFGYIEYGYSTTNFAAAQAGFAPHAPTFSVERDGRWVPLREDWGFPGGYPRWMAVDLADLLRRGDRRLRIETNLEIAWDQILLASAGPPQGLDVHELDADRADLRYRGFPAAPPPGDDVEGFRYGEFEPWDHFRAMPGRYTRYGDVRELLRDDDDRFAILGPGDEIRFEFRADRLPRVSPNRVRSFFWKSGGYCKDMDLYTGDGEGIEPLPFAGMRSYPLADGEAYPSRRVLTEYRRRWNTRVIEGGHRTAVRDVMPSGSDTRELQGLRGRKAARSR